MVDKITRAQPGDYVGQLLAEQVAREFDKLADVPFLEGVELLDVSLVASTAQTLTHKLGRVPRGWLVTRVEGAGASVSAGDDAELLVQTAGTNGTVPGSPYQKTVTWDQAPAEGNLLVLGVAYPSSTYSVSSVTQSGVTWTLAARESTTTALASELWYAAPPDVGASAGTTITVTFTAATSGSHVAIACAELKGVDNTLSAAAVLDATALGQDSGAANRESAAAVITPSINSALLVGEISHEEETDVQVGVSGGFRKIHHQPGASGAANPRVALYARRTNAPVSHSLGTAFLTAGRRNSTVLGAFQLSAAGGGLNQVPSIVATAKTKNDITFLSNLAATVDLWVF